MPKKVEITGMKVAISHLELAVYNAVKQATVHDLTEEHRIAMRTFVKQLEPLAEVSPSGGLDDTVPISEFAMPQFKIVTATDSISGDKKDADTADRQAHGVDVAIEEHKGWDEWFRKIVNRFKLWSTGSSGSIDGNSLYNKLHLLHRHPNTKIRWQSTCLRRVLIAADQDGDGSIEMADLIQLMDVRNSPAVREAVLALEFLLVESDTITIKEDAPQGKYVVLQTSKYRIAWDCLMTSFLFYISIALPYTIAFYDDNSMPSTLDTIDTVINSFFIVDLISNFFTSYKDRDDREITHLRLTALHYFRTWFFIDLVSSIPTFQAAKMLKFSKLSKVFRMLRIAKVKHLITCCEDQMDELSGSVPLTISLSGLTMLVSGVFISHWLACFMLTVTTSGFLRIYAQEVGDSDGQRYIAALYWAMTTITTVGYGDIVPGTDAERGYAMCAMVIGGSFYGYVIGSMVSLIHQVNLNQEGYAEKMENPRAWFGVLFAGSVTI